MLLLDVAQDFPYLAFGNLSTTMICQENLSLWTKTSVWWTIGPDFDCVEFRQIITVRDTLEQLLSVRDMDEAMTKVFVSVKSSRV